MTTEWQIDRLDLEAYLARIGYDGVRASTARALSALHRAHVATIPFENLDIVLGRGISVALDDVQAKLVNRRRGGYCYEHGVLFAAVLERLGYSVDRLLARIGADEQRPRPRSHMTLRVRTNAGQWLADVGFGAGLLEPLRWDDAGGESRQGSWTYQLVARGSGTWHLRERLGPEWQVLYTLTGDRQHASDVEVANHFTATHPSSPFTGQLVVMRRDLDTRRRLLGRRLSTTRPDGTTDERTLTDTEVGDALRNDFGLSLGGQETAGVVASLPVVDAT